MAHWFNPLLFFFLAAIKSRESALGELRPVELIPSNFFTGFKAKISKEPTQGALRPIGLIPTNFLTICKAIISGEFDQGVLRTIGLIPHKFFDWLQGNNFKRVSPRVTQSHWVNP